MNNKPIRYACFIVMLLMASCSQDDSLKRMEQIKRVGDEDPAKALIMLDSLETGIRDGSDYARRKYELLRIRLNDKAGKIPSSDIMIKELVDYFEKEGSILEKQEAYYYAGSTYRDLHDAPRALEFFFKSLDCAADSEETDSFMLRNTFSNLTFLQYRVQNFNEALRMAQKEQEICRKLGSNRIIPFMHIGASYLALDSARQAEAAFDSAYSHIIGSEDVPNQQEVLVRLLNDYSELKRMSKAKACLSLIKANPLVDFSPFPCIAFAQYYESSGKNDSAAVYCRRILDDGTDINNMYDTAKLLYRMYAKAGDSRLASQYAGIYMQLSDSLDFGKRQELAATVNNEYQYHLDQQKEQDWKDERERYRQTLLIASLVVVIMAGIAYIFYVKRRSQHLRQIVGLSLDLQRASDDGKQLREDINKKKKELAESKKLLKKSSDELNSIKQEFQRVNTELSEYGNAIKMKEDLLAERMEQNRVFLHLLHQSELEGRAEDVIQVIRESSKGKRDMSPADWKQLYRAVDELYPSFQDSLLKEPGAINEQQMQLCYLMRIGLSNSQIQGMMHLSHATTWRWVKKYEWVLAGEPVPSKPASGKSSGNRRRARPSGGGNRE